MLASNLSITCLQTFMSSFRPLWNGSTAGRVPPVWMHKLILLSEGWVVVYHKIPLLGSSWSCNVENFLGYGLPRAIQVSYSVYLFQLPGPFPGLSSSRLQSLKSSIQIFFSPAPGPLLSLGWFLDPQVVLVDQGLCPIMWGMEAKQEENFLLRFSSPSCHQSGKFLKPDMQL